MDKNIPKNDTNKVGEPEINDVIDLTDEKEDDAKYIMNNEVINLNEDEPTKSYEEKGNGVVSANVTKEKDGKIILNASDKIKGKKGYLYQILGNKFNISKEKKIYTWKIEFLNFSEKNKHHKIGIGLSVVNNNINNKFIALKNNTFKNIYLLYRKHDKEKNKTGIFQYNPHDITYNSFIINFPSFIVGQKITINYRFVNSRN